MEKKGTCKICNSPELVEFISFGKMPVSNAFLKKEDLHKEEFYYNMAVGFCKKCYMAQLIELVPYDKYIVPDESGKNNYAFFTSTSKFMEKHFTDLAKELEEKFLHGNLNILEIGSNDGTLLKAFKKRESVLGVEPSHNVAEVAQKQGIETLTEFFTNALAKKIVKEKGNFRAVVSTNVTLNIIDLHDFIDGVRTLLDEKGVFISEDPHITGILEQNSYDQIYDEHIWQFSLLSLSNLFEMHGMELFDAEKLLVHGGSIRIYACKKGAYEKTKRLHEYLALEKEKKLHTPEPYLNFAKSVRKNREALTQLLKNLKSRGKKIVGYAAASKGTIVQNYCDIGPDIIDYISDSTPFKQGLYSPGKHIPVVSPEVFHNDKEADYALLFAWNHAKEIMQKENDFLRRGGKFIVHLPYARILEKIEGVEVKNIQKFSDEEGHLFETLRADDVMFNKKFGQNLISYIKAGVIKGLHKHQDLTEYTTCIHGNVLYIIIKEIEGEEPLIEKYEMGERNMITIKTPPGVWHGYITLDNKEAIISYTMDKPYDPENIDQQSKDPYTFGDIWNSNNLSQLS